MNQITENDTVFCYPDVEIHQIRNYVLDDLIYDKDFEIHFLAIEEIVLKNGVVFFSPGGSFKRRILQLITVQVNSKERKFRGRNSFKMLKSKEIRAHLDPIATKILEKLHLIN